MELATHNHPARIFSHLTSALFVLATLATVPTPALSQGNSPITLTLQSSGYEKWGRPLGMDDSNQGCSRFNDSRPVTKFNASVNVANAGTKTLENWYLFVFKNTGSEAFVCYYITDDSFPNIEPGQSANVTFAAFMEQGESAARILVVDKDAGQSNTISFGTAAKATATPKPTATPKGAKPTKPAKGTATPAPAATPASGIKLEVQSSGAEAWGRPAGMDNPKAGCGGFDDSRPVTKYNLSLRVTNTTQKDMIRWYAKVMKQNGAEAYVCHYAYATGLPAIGAGQSADVTFAAFMERGETAKSIIIADDDVGTSNEVAVR